MSITKIFPLLEAKKNLNGNYFSVSCLRDIVATFDQQREWAKRAGEGLNTHYVMKNFDFATGSTQGLIKSVAMEGLMLMAEVEILDTPAGLEVQKNLAKYELAFGGAAIEVTKLDDGKSVVHKALLSCCSLTTDKVK